MGELLTCRRVHLVVRKPLATAGSVHYVRMDRNGGQKKEKETRKLLLPHCARAFFDVDLDGRQS